jgi:hypothetical protein
MKLDENARKALSAIYRRGILRGRDVQRLAGLKDATELGTALRSLADNKFITLQLGSSSDTDQGYQEAFVAPLPSKKAEGEYEINQPMDPASSRQPVQ